MVDMSVINDTLKNEFMLQLRERENLPEDLAETYIHWVRGLVQRAAPTLVPQGLQPQEGQEGQEGQAQQMPQEA